MATVLLAGNRRAAAQAADSFINEDGVKMYKYVQQMPQFKGDLGLYVAQHLHYPDSAKARGIQGRVKLQFVVNERGRIDSITVLESAHPLLDAEAVRMVRKMPRWIPGRNLPDKKAVKTWFTLPVMFRLDEGAD